MHLAELWVLGDKLIAPQLQILAIEAIITIANEDSTSPLATFPYIYENTVEGSPLRILARQFCSINMREEYSKHFDLFPKQLLIDYILYLEEETGYDPSGPFSVEDYYVNET